MTHPIDAIGRMPAAAGGLQAAAAAIGRALRAALAALRARHAAAQAEAARQDTLRALEALGPDWLYDIGLRDGDVRRLRRGDTRL